MSDKVATLPPNDLHGQQLQSMATQRAVEVTHMHVFHAPNDPLDVNGFTFVIRDGEQTYTLSLREGSKADGLEPVEATPFQTGAEDYMKLVGEREEALATLMAHLGTVSPLMLELVDDFKASH